MINISILLYGLAFSSHWYAFSISAFSSMSVVHPMQGLITPWWTVFLFHLLNEFLLPEPFSSSSCRGIFVFVFVPGSPLFIRLSWIRHWLVPGPPFFCLVLQSQGVGLWVKPCMHDDELPCLNILWPSLFLWLLYQRNIWSLTEHRCWWMATVNWITNSYNQDIQVTISACTTCRTFNCMGYNSRKKNPIEHILDVLELEICNMDVQPTNLQQLCNAIMPIWTKISEECFQHLVKCIPWRIKPALWVKVGLTR